VGSNDVFWNEIQLIEEATRLLEESEYIDKRDYSKLISAYRTLLNQTKKLTKMSDRHQNKLSDLLERISRYVPAPLYKKITQGKEKVEINHTKRVKLTIFFSDIMDFSSHSANMEGEALSAILNSYLEEMTNIVNKHGGTLDKYIGDAIMVFFGDPDYIDDFEHARRCLNMALEMRQRMKELQKHWFDLGYPDPLHIRMGISTGFVSAGNFGSSEHMDYTVIGTAVNLASRLQEYAAADQILIAHETWGFVKDHVICKEPQFIKELKGFSKGVYAYEVVGLKDKLIPQTLVYEDKARDVVIRFSPDVIAPSELNKIIEELLSQRKALSSEEQEDEYEL